MQHQLSNFFGKTSKKHIEGENYFAVEIIPVIAKGNSLTVFTTEATRVLCKRHCFTKPDI
jgi:hypothetical protein